MKSFREPISQHSPFRHSSDPLLHGAAVLGPDSQERLLVWAVTLFWIVWFSVAWRTQHVPSTCWATV